MTDNTIQISEQEINTYISKYGWDRSWGGWGPKRNSLTRADAIKALTEIKKKTMTPRTLNQER